MLSLLSEKQTPSGERMAWWLLETADKKICKELKKNLFKKNLQKSKREGLYF